MRMLLLANNRLGLEVATYLRRRGDQVVGAVLHPPSKRTYGDDIVRVLDLPPAGVLDASQIHDASVLDAIRRLQPDMAVSILFGYILAQ